MSVSTIQTVKGRVVFLPSHTPLANLVVASVYDNPIKNLGVLTGVVPSFDVSAAREGGTDTQYQEVDKALQVYDVTVVEVNGHLLEIEDQYVGDVTGDGIDDVGIVVSWMDVQKSIIMIKSQVTIQKK